MNDLGAGKKRVALVTLDTLFEANIPKIADQMPQVGLVVTTSAAGALPKTKQLLGTLLKKIPSGKGTPIQGKTVLDFHRDVQKKFPGEPPGVPISPDDLGYIQYTGGTTGAPKGAMLSHRNHVHNIKSIIAWVGWGRGGGILLSGFPMFHIAGLTIGESAVYLGWPQILIPNPRDTDHICKAMQKEQCRKYLVSRDPLF